MFKKRFTINWKQCFPIEYIIGLFQNNYFLAYILKLPFSASVSYFFNMLKKKIIASYLKSINDLKLSFASKHVPGELPNSFCFFNNLFPSGTCSSFCPEYIKGETKTRQMC